jgi:hypothetical protein
VRRELVIATLLGSAVGLATAIGLYALYPPGRAATWPIPALAVGSLLLLGVLYALSARSMGLRAGDWLVIGYLAVLVVGSALVVGGEAFEVWRLLVASNLGA